MSLRGQRIRDYSQLDVRIEADLLFEYRFDYDGDADIEFIGINRQPNAPEDQATWFIIKLHYQTISSEKVIVRKELPNEGVQFKYVWDDRATYFS